MKKITRSILSCLLGIIVLSGSISVQAAVVNNGQIYDIVTNQITGWPDGTDINSETAVLMEAETGTILYDKGMSEPRYPASITKVMTALIALENASLDDIVVFTEACQAGQGWDSSNSGMIVGEELTMLDALKALMVKSANDVAIQIAVHVAGSVEAFADMMNQKAADLGCQNTHFTNPHGLEDENHYTTAYDMALIFREAIKNQTFREIIAAENVEIPPTNMNPEPRNYKTHVGLITPERPDFYYEGCFGGKTGNTTISGPTLVSGAERNGMTLIAVTMKSISVEPPADHVLLYDYGFNNFHKEEVPGGKIVIPSGQDVNSLATEDVVNGETEIRNYYIQDHLVGSGSVPEPTAAPEVLQPETEICQPQIVQEEQPQPQPEQENDQSTMVYTYIIYTLSGLIVIGIIGIIARSLFHRKQRNKRGK